MHAIANPRRLLAGTVTLLVLVPVSGTRAADPALGAPLCAVLKKLLPEVKNYRPEGARAQLVAAVAEKFDYDGAKLRSVRAEVDSATTASCPREREGMLGVLKMRSLSEALT